MLLGSATIAASVYTRPSEQLAREKLACAQKDGLVTFDPSEGIKENKLTEQCRILLGSSVEAKLNWPARLWLD